MIVPAYFIIASRDSAHWLGLNGQWTPDRLEAIRLTEEQARIATATMPTACDAWRVS